MQNLDAKLTQINNAINSAISSINLAKNLLKDIQAVSKDAGAKSVPGVFGKFLGDSMQGEDGQKYAVSPNYAAKSMLVYGDTLKMVEENGEKRFKQVQRVKRLHIDGILAKKEGRWHAVTSDGSHRVSDAAVEYLGGKEGSQVTIVVPLDEKMAPFATLEAAGGVTMEAKKLESKKVEKPTELVADITPVESIAPVVQETSPAPIEIKSAEEVKSEPVPVVPRPAPVAKRVVKRTTPPMPTKQPAHFSGATPVTRREPTPVAAPAEAKPAVSVKAPELTDEDLR